uniref:Glutathione S-transferase C-terminal domain-containing protein n=1 Tax=Acrobeloides nanus TaxID=290746 RepID=A0A914DUS7_9BILA
MLRPVLAGSHDLPILEKLLNEAGTGFFGKAGVTWVDFYVIEFINTLEGVEPETLNKVYPHDFGVVFLLPPSSFQKSKSYQDWT